MDYANYYSRAWERDYALYRHDPVVACSCAPIDEGGDKPHPICADGNGNLYSCDAASSLYHSLNVKENILKLFRKLDHMMIFVLIAGTYTPVCMLVLGGKTGMLLLSLIWGIALVGIVLKALWINCPKWFSSIIYIAMGWVCLLVFPILWEKLSTAAFAWLLAGGILYTVGGVVYALKLKGFNGTHQYFGSHEIFHLFVMAGSFCHFIVMYCYVV